MDKLNALKCFLWTRVGPFQYVQPFPHDVGIYVRSRPSDEFAACISYPRDTASLRDIIASIPQNSDQEVLFKIEDDNSLPQSFRV